LAPPCSASLALQVEVSGCAGALINSPFNAGFRIVPGRDKYLLVRSASNAGYPFIFLQFIPAPCSQSGREMEIGTPIAQKSAASALSLEQYQLCFIASCRYNPEREREAEGKEKLIDLF